MNYHIPASIFPSKLLQLISQDFPVGIVKCNEMYALVGQVFPITCRPHGCPYPMPEPQGLLYHMAPYKA